MGSFLTYKLQQFDAEFFKALGHPLRIQILELLESGDKNVNELQTLLEVEESSIVSQQLAVLRAKNIVVGNKEGTKVSYTVKDPTVFELLAVARKIFNNHLIDTISMLEKIKESKGSKE